MRDWNVSFAALRDAFHSYGVAQAREAETEAPKFNLFRILRLDRDEVRLHSALLAHWLNPRGSHGQQALFLETFWEEISQCHDSVIPPPAMPWQFGRWRISAEKFTIHGNLDLVLESPAHEVLCVVENKIDAGEGSEQLRRYRKWLDSQARYRTRLLFFLTPDGRLSETLTDESAYTCLSYRHHITHWLTRTIPKIRCPKVRVIAEQYLDIVDHLEVEP